VLILLAEIILEIYVIECFQSVEAYECELVLFQCLRNVSVGWMSWENCLENSQNWGRSTTTRNVLLVRENDDPSALSY
jgi:hypothetical protein